MNFSYQTLILSSPSTNLENLGLVIVWIKYNLGKHGLKQLGDLCMCLKQLCFADSWKILIVFHVFKNVGKRYMTKNYCHCPVTLLSLANKIFVKFVNNWFLYNPKTSGVISDLQYGFTSSSGFIIIFWKCITKIFCL